MKARGILAVAAVADNAANFQAVSLSKALLLRCSAHTIQLLANDMLLLFEEELRLCTELRLQYVSIPQPVETRWNSKYRMLEYVAKNKGKFGHVPIEKLALIDVAAHLLKPIADATDVVQGDKATTYDAIAALQLILAAASGSTSFCGELRRCILNRKSQMFTAPIIVLSFYCPIVRREKYEEHVHTHVLRTACEMRYIGELVHGPESLNDCMESFLFRK